MIIQTTLGEFCPFKYGKGLSANKRISGNFPVFGSNGVVGCHNEAYVETHGIVIGRKGSVGALHISDCPFWPIDTSFYVVKGDYFETLYTFYLLRSLGLDGMNSDSAVPGLNRDNAHALKVNILEKREERSAVGKLISKFDEKIENNRRMNETLEEMARAIFKSWFVDFDPVHAKAAGNAPAHMDAETAALFPSSFGDDGLPEGWVNRPLDEIAEFLNGAAMQKFPSEGSEFLPVIKIAELRSGLSSNTNRASLNVPEKYVISDGDVLFAWSGSLMQKVWTEGKGALNQHLFKVTSDNYQKWFFFYWIDHHMKWFQSIAASKATTMGHIQRKHLSEAEVCVPNESIMNCASDVISPLLEKQTQNSIESRTLAELRDTLLPKLMSGEIRVSDAEREVEAAV